MLMSSKLLYLKVDLIRDFLFKFPVHHFIMQNIDNSILWLPLFFGYQEMYYVG